MKQLITFIIVLMLSTTLPAQAQETAPVVQSFACHYNEGRGANDLRAAVEYWNDQVDSIDSQPLKQMGAYVFAPYVATTGSDFFFVSVYPNLNVMAGGDAAYLTNPAGQAADRRFAEVGHCEANLYLSEQLFDALPDPEEGDDYALIEGYGCKLNPGKTLADAAKAEKSWTEVATAHGAQVDTFRWIPLNANTPGDVFYLVASNDLVSFGDYRTKWVTSKDSQDVDAKFNSVMNCESYLMHGFQARAPQVPQ